MVRTHQSFHKVAALPVSESISTYGNHLRHYCRPHRRDITWCLHAPKNLLGHYHPVSARRLVGPL